MRERTHGEGFATRAIHAGERPDPITHAHNTPIYATATFAFDTAAEKEDAVDRAMAWDPTAYFYSRTGNPTNRALEEKLASLEGAEDCVVAASGMACGRGDPVRAPRGGRPPGRRRRAVRDHDRADGGGPPAARHRRHGRRHDGPRGGRGGDHPGDAGAVPRVARRTRGCGSPDLDALAALAHRHGLIVVADNTFLGPALLRPLEHGADLVLHAATKYLSGHGDAVSGVVAGPSALLDPIRKQTDTFGQAASPFSSFLVLRGVRTLPLRSAQGSANAARLAAFLEAHPKVEWVRYPGLASHPDHAVATRLLGDRSAAMLTFQPRGGVDGMAAFTDHLRAVRHRRQPGRRLHARLPAAEARRARSASRSAARTSTTCSRTSSSASRSSP